MTINATRKIISLTGPNCSFGNINACRVDVVKASAFSHGDSVTITGSGFGSHTLDLAFAGGADGHIETTSLGNDASFGNWYLPTGAPFITKQIVNDNQTRGKVWFTSDVGSSVYDATIGYDYGADIPEQTRIYISWWTKKDSLNNVGQWKLLRLNSTNSITDGHPQMRFFAWPAADDQHSTQSDATTGTTYFGVGNMPTGDDSWYRVEVEILTSTQGVKNGNVGQRLHHAGVIANKTWSYSGDASPKWPTIRTYDSSARFRWILFQNYLGNGINDGDIWHDDHYIQVGTFKRVELCDSATYASATVREIQKPTAWSDGSVTVTLNKGGLSTGTYFLHVVGENNTSLGYREIGVT